MKKFLATALAGAAMMSFANAGQAATLVVTSHSSVHTGNSAFTADVDKVTNPKVSYDKVKVSPQTINGTLDGSAVSLFAYCVDIYEFTANVTYDVQALASVMSPSTANKLAALVSARNLDVLNSAVVADSALQLAIWETLYETKAYNIATGDFKISNLTDKLWGNSGENAVKTAAASYLSSIGSVTVDTSLQFFVAQSKDSSPTSSKGKGAQDLLYWTKVPPPAVPEPATWAMMLIGFGAIGHAMRSRRRTKVSFA